MTGYVQGGDILLLILWKREHMKTKEKRKNIINWIKRAVCCCVALALLGTAVLLTGNWYVKRSAGKKILDMPQLDELTDVDCIMILGCGLRADGEPTRMLKDRLDQGIALYQAGVAPKLLVSGDHGRVQYDEVNKMKQYAVEHGVPSEDVFMDHAGFSTYESMYRARDVFQVERMVIVTQEYHLWRAVYDANALGIDAYGSSALKVRYGGQRLRDLREILARNKDLLYCMVKPKPTYLGEVIPVNGDGDVTND